MPWLIMPVSTVKCTSRHGRSNELRHKNLTVFRILLLHVHLALPVNSITTLCLDRWDTSKPENHYWRDDTKRTLAENRVLAEKSTNNYGCIKQPLLNIPIDNIRVDELHLFLRVTGFC